MDFFNGKIDAQITPASLQFLAIVDPSLSRTEDDSINQVLLFLSNETNEEINDNYKLNKIGIVQGMNDFIQNFQKSDQLNYIELNNQLVIFDVLEGKYQIIMSLKLTEIKDDGVVEHTSHDIAPVKFLSKAIRQGYEDFRLHNGPIAKLSSTDEGTKQALSQWWTIWFKNFQLELIENGSLKLYDGYRKAYGYETPTIPHQSCVNLYIFNTSKANPEKYGLIHDHTESFTQSSKTRLLNWIEEQDSYTISAQSLILPQVIKNVKLPMGNYDSSEIVYDPFKLVFNTLSDISKYSGVTAGVSAGVSGVSSGISTLNGYLPTWMGGKVRKVDDGDEGVGDPEGVVDKEYGFLIGRIGDDILRKKVWLQLERGEEKQFRVVVFRYLELLFISVYEADENEDESSLDKLDFYKELELKFVEIGKEIKTKEVKEKNFYFMIFDKFEHSILSNLPNIPTFDDEEVNDLKYFHDLSKSQTQSQILHKEIIKMIDSRAGVDNDDTDHQLEKLKRTKNGWWIYKLNHQNIKEILIIKKWQVLSKNGGGATGDVIRNRILDNSTSILGSIGKDAKLWLEDYLTKSQV